MLSNLTAQPQDKILALMAAYRADPRETKIDLGVGVYKDATGATPVMRAIKSAEELLWKTQETKAYVGLAGDPAFSAAMIDLVLGGTVDADRLSAVATPGGTGAVRQALELVKIAAPGATVWLSNPTWPNHPSIVKYLGMPLAEYRYFDSQTGDVDFDAMLADIKAIPAGDIVLLHGCCHNPTGANLSAEQEDQIIAALAANGAIPFVDIAYQGFGDGLEDDARFTRKIASQLPECLIAASCSKNFGIYRERTGILNGHLAIRLTSGSHPRQYGLFEPSKLLLSTRSRRAAGYDDFGRYRATQHLVQRAGRYPPKHAQPAPTAGR
jgi:aromatic-amino-acid transaminase